MFYPVYEIGYNDKIIAAVLEYSENDIQHKSAPVAGFPDEKFISSQDVKQHAYIGRVEDYIDDVYLEEDDERDTLSAAQHTLVQYIIKYN